MGRATHLPSAPMEPKLLWRPSAERAERATIARFARAVGREGDYDELWRWSVDDLEGFWARDLGVLRRAGLRAVRARARAPRDARRASGSRGRGCPTPSTSSAAATTTPSRSATPASCASSSQWTWGELREQTARIAAGLRRLGVGPGRPRRRLHAEHPRDDRGLPGHARRSARCGRARAPEFGARSVVDRFAQIEPKVLLAVDGYRYGGRDFDRREVVAGDRRGDRRAGRALRLPRRRRLAGGARRPTTSR